MNLISTLLYTSFTRKFLNFVVLYNCFSMNSRIPMILVAGRLWIRNPNYVITRGFEILHIAVMSDARRGINSKFITDRTHELAKLGL